jgi:hypothetical protein
VSTHVHRLPRPSLCLLAALAAACAGDAPPALTAAGIGFDERELLGLSEDRRRLLGELAAFGVAVADPTAAPDLTSPIVEARERDRLWQLVQARGVLDEAGADDAVLEARYRTDPRWELTVRHLLIVSPRYETEATRALARDKAERALARIRAGEDLARVAAELSEEPGAEGRQGLLTPGREGSWVREFWNAALALEPGEVSGVVETRYGFHVLRLESRRVVSFDEARWDLTLDLARMLADIDTDAGSAPLPPGFQVEADVLASWPGDLPPTPADERVVARWEGGSLSLDTLAAALAGLPYTRWRAATSGDDAERRRGLESVARAVAAARSAAARGIEVSEAWRTAEARSLEERGNEWARALGFTPALPRARVKEAAWAALAATSQNASLAREAVRRDLGAALHRAFSIETAPAGGP